MLLPALVGWAVAALAIWLRPGWPVVMVVGVVALVAVALASRGRNRGVVEGALVAAIAAGMLLSVVLGSLHRDQGPLLEHEDSEVSVTLSLRETFTPGNRTLQVTLLSIEGTALTGGGVSAELVGVDWEERAAYGSTADAQGYLQRADTWDNNSWSLILRGETQRIQPPGGFLSGSDELRRGLVDRSARLQGDGGRLLPGLAIGDTSAVDRGLVQAMRDTSLSHLVAVSGANCAIVVGIVVALVSLLGGGVWAQLTAGSAALAGFVTVVTPEPSIVRASIMAVIVLIFLAWGNPVRGIPVLGMTVLILLSVNPWMALDFAFALSVLASGGILLLVGPLSDLLESWAPRWLAIVIAIPIAAQVACQPLLILLNPVIPVWSVLANALAAPAAPVATIVGMLVCLSGPLAPPLADLLAWLAWWPSAFVAFVGRFFSSLPLVTVPFVPGLPGALLMAGITYGLSAVVVLRHPSHRVVRRIAGAIASVSLGTVALGYSLPASMLSASVPKDWAVAQCDVGQGDALLVRSGGGTLLIDTGKYPVKLRECLSLLGVHRIDLAIISHFDADHVGAWPEIADQVDQVWVGPVLEDDHQRIVEAWSSAGAQVVEVGAGSSAEFGDYRLRVVWPVSKTFADPGNDSSVVVALEGADNCTSCVDALFLGDLGAEPQRIVMGRERFTGLDIIKVSHHGSRDQDANLYRSVGASVGLIGVGEENTYGHPTESALNMLEASGIHSLRSDLLGTLTISVTDQGALTFWSERDAGSQ